ncbi:hypothetical protein D3C73_1369560 [compost metagenome]
MRGVGWRNRHRRHDADVIGGNATVGQQLLDEIAYRDDPVRQAGVGQQRIHRAHQVARAHHQRRAAEACARGGNQGIATAGGVDHVVALAAHQP